jgi:hypothetical protein
MKLPQLKLLLLLCVLSVSALNVFADNKVVTSSTTESNQSYDDSNTTTQAALNVSGNNITYTGTNITLSATNNGGPTNAIGKGAYINNNGILSLTGGTISTTGNYGSGVSINRGSGTLNNVTIKTTGGYSAGVSVTNATTQLTDCDISSNASNALNITDRSTVTANLNNNTINGIIYVSNTSSLTLSGSNGTVITGNVVIRESGTIAITLTGANTAFHGNIDRGTPGKIDLTVGAGALFHGAGRVDNLTLASGAIIGYTGGTGLNAYNSVSIGDGILVDLSALTEPGAYDVLWISASSGVTISEDQFTATNLDESLQGTFNVKNNQLTFNATAVPEPSTWFLIGAGLGALALIRRRSS